jgi:hypothetical protein
MNIENNEASNWDQNYREFAEDLKIEGGRTERLISNLVNDEVDSWESFGDVAPATITLNTTDIGIDRASLYTDAVTSVSAAVDPADYDEFAKRFLADEVDPVDAPSSWGEGVKLSMDRVREYVIQKAELLTIGPDNHSLGDLESFVIEPRVRKLTARQKRREERSAAIAAYYAFNFSNTTEEDLKKYVTSQAIIKRHPSNIVRRDNILMKRANTNEMLGIDLVAESAHEHGSRAIRRKVSHDARKGTKPGLFGRGSVKLTDADLVERHGRSALAVLSEDRFRKALDELNAAGRRLDLRAKSAFQKTVETLSEVMGRRVA